MTSLDFIGIEMNILIKLSKSRVFKFYELKKKKFNLDSTSINITK